MAVFSFYLGKINVLSWNVLNGWIRRFAERQGVAHIGNHAARDGTRQAGPDCARWKSDGPGLEA
jgi:hypothetical protein